MSDKQVGAEHSPPPPYSPSGSIQSSQNVQYSQHQVQTPQIIYQPPPPLQPPTSSVNVQPPYSAVQPGVTYVPYQPQPQPQEVHIISVRNAPPVAGTQILSHVPIRMICPFCNHDIMTTVTTTPGLFAYLFAFIMFFVCCPLMWVPCVIPACMDKTHSCPVCRSILANVRTL